jgi:hypothetical protein
MRDEFAISIAAEGPIIDQILRLLLAVNRLELGYCYWKSGQRLRRALAGDTDLDILVAAADQHRMRQCLLECGFKLFPAVPGREDAACTSYLGYDEPSGRLAHVHLHTRIVSGHRLVLDYYLPWAGQVIERAVLHPNLPIRVLDPTSEALLLIVRSCLELRVDDPVALRNFAAACGKFEADRHALRATLDPSKLRAMAEELLDADLARQCVEAMASERTLQQQRGLRRAIRRHLAPYRRFNAIAATLRGAGRAVRLAAGTLNRHYLHLPRGWHRRAPGGGVVVALLGVDGSGKSTAVAALRQWMGAEVDVMPIYFGTGDGRPSLILLPLKLLVPVFSRFALAKTKDSSHGTVSARSPGPIYGVLLTLWASVLAVEKRGKLRRARRAADRGLVVIADRYPQDQIVSFNDGPLLPRLASVPRWLRDFEMGSYRLARRLAPDLVIKLMATQQVLETREPTMNRDVIRQRLSELSLLSFPTSEVLTVDATQPLADVLRDVKRAVWRLL